MAQSSNFPNFFIVGAAKAGTTSVYNYLLGHPQVYLSPIKEPHHFSTDINLEYLRDSDKKKLSAQAIDKFIESDMNDILHRAYITDRKQYLALFRFANNAKAIGEASVSYLYSKTAAEEIFAFNPSAKIIIVLRNPSKRAWSHYLMDLRIGNTHLSFKNALEEDRKHPYKTWGAASLYIELGFYYEQVKRYLDIFPNENVHIILQEDLKKDSQEIIKNIYSFLNIDENFQPNLSSKHNSANIPRNKILNKIMGLGVLRVHVRKLLKRSPLKLKLKKLIYIKPEISTEDNDVIQSLNKLYMEDIHKLEELINRDLSTWN